MTRSQHGVPYKTWLLRMGDFGSLAASPSPLQLFLREAENPWLPLSFTQPSSEHLDSLIKSLFLRLLLLPKALLPSSSHSLKNLRKTQGTNLILQHWSGIAIPAPRERGARLPVGFWGAGNHPRRLRGGCVCWRQHCVSGHAGALSCRNTLILKVTASPHPPQMIMLELHAGHSVVFVLLLISDSLGVSCCT